MWMINVDDILKHKSNFYFVRTLARGYTKCSRGKSLEKLIFTTKLTSDMIAAGNRLSLSLSVSTRTWFLEGLKIRPKTLCEKRSFLRAHADFIDVPRPSEIQDGYRQFYSASRCL